MNSPTEQLIRDYLNRLSVASRGRLGFAERQSLLDRTRARIEAECGGMNGASAVRVRKALADLGDPVVLVELEADQVANATSTAAERYEPPVAGNGNREMAAEDAHAIAAAKGSEIGEDLLVTGGPDGSKPGRGGSSIRSVLAGLAAARRRRRRSDRTGQPSAQAAPRGGPRAPASGRTGGRHGESSGWSGAKPGLIPAPRRPTAPDRLSSPDLLAAPDPRDGLPPGRRPAQARPVRAQPVGARPAEARPAGGGAVARLVRGVVEIMMNNTLEVLAVVLLGVGGAVYPPIWLVGALLGLPSKKWDIRDKFFGVTLPFFLLIIGTVVIIVFGGERATISAYAYEAWLGAGRLSRVLALAGALYLTWRLRRGRRQPKQPPWNVPHRLG